MGYSVTSSTPDLISWLTSHLSGDVSLFRDEEALPEPDDGGDVDPRAGVAAAERRQTDRPRRSGRGAPQRRRKEPAAKKDQQPL